jgi:Dolichyl-phosphate-mannose-protein mannosyltransferase
VSTQCEGQVESAEANPPLWARPWFVFLVTLGLRLAVVPFLVGDRLNPARDHWVFGWETGRIARSLASGHGFGSPFFGWTGPTAWMGPVYPALVAGVFKVFGIYSAASAYVILSFNCLFAALTCFPLDFIARTAFGKKTATAATWAWAIFPYSFDFAAGQVWNTTLSALLFVLAVAVTIALERKVDLRSWVIWGVVWAIAGLTEPALLVGLPVAGIWLGYRLRQRGTPWNFMWRPALAALAFLVLVSPWFIRNERVFGRFIPFRSNFWLAFYQGNTWDTFDVYPDWANPPHSQVEMDDYARLGEVAYMAEKKQLAIAEVREHPGRFAWTTLRRIVFTWTGYWNLSAAYRRIEPFAVPNIFIATLLSAFAAFGLARAFSSAPSSAVLFAWLLLVFPAVYYITHPSMLYRHPLDPLLALLSVSTFTGLGSAHKSEASRSEVEMEVNA